MQADRPDYRGQTVACIASGPSLTAADVEAVRGLTCIVTNTTWRLAPWADTLFAMDGAWWRVHAGELADFKGRRVATSHLASASGAAVVYGVKWFRPHGYGNSGACAVAWAVAGRARRVILLGFDCQPGAGGAIHWHGNHPAPLGNGRSMKRWAAQFADVARLAADEGVEVVNASRSTALTCWPRVQLEDVLCTA